MFIDAVCPKPYDTTTLETEPQGGTESTVTRLADRLAARHEVVVFQPRRDLASYAKEPGKALYSGVPLSNPDSVVVLRNPKGMQAVREQYPNAKLFLWLHDIVSADMVHHVQLLTETKTTVICVSEWHRTQCIETLKVGGYTGQFPVKRIYNPIDDDLKPDGILVDKNKLVFFSSPHKGLERTLNVFKNVRSFLPGASLYIANPGYYPDSRENAVGIHQLGSLSHGTVLEHVRSALCVFHLNDVFPETFGLVYAEANAVGTPFITHPIGATHEVSDHPAQLVNVKDPKQVIDRLVAWHSGNRPIVRGNPEFRLSKVVQEWNRLLD